MTTTEQLRKFQHYQGWVGTLGDLKRLLRIAEGALAPHVSAYVEGVTAWRVERLESVSKAAEQATADSGTASEAMRPAFASSAERYQEQIRTAELELQAARRVAEDRAAMSIELTESGGGNRTLTGPADEIVERLEGKKFETMAVSIPNSAPMAYRIRITTNADGLSISVSSDSTDWVQSTYAYLDEEIRNHVPKWAFVRNAALLVPVFSIISASLVWFCLNLLAAIATESGEFEAPIQTLGWVCIAIWFCIGGIAGTLYVRKRIPAVEVTHGGKASRGSALVKISGGALASVGLALLSNGISDAFF